MPSQIERVAEGDVGEEAEIVGAGRHRSAAALQRDLIVVERRIDSSVLRSAILAGEPFSRANRGSNSNLEFERKEESRAAPHATRSDR